MPAATTDKDLIVSEVAPTLLLSAQTLAKRLAVSIRTLWRLRSAGKLPPPVRLGGAVRWRGRHRRLVGGGLPSDPVGTQSAKVENPVVFHRPFGQPYGYAFPSQVCANRSGNGREEDSSLAQVVRTVSRRERSRAMRASLCR